MCPDVAFIRQPFSEGGTAAAFIEECLADERTTQFTAVVAWARYRGLARLQPALDGFHSRGGLSTIVVGIDEGGATRPGLFGAFEMFSAAYVFHDPRAMTFHPKVFLAEGGDYARILVGSSNATPGGLWSNYEASVAVRFALPDEQAEPALADARRFVSDLITDEHACRPLTAELIETLLADTRYRVSGHERRQASAPKQVPAGLENDDIDETGSTDGAQPGPPIFSRSTRATPTVPALSAEARQELTDLERDVPIPPELPTGTAPGSTGNSSSTTPQPTTPQRPTQPVSPQPQPPTHPVTPHSWRKKLPSSDAQRNVGHKTSNLRLVKGESDIDWRTWFRTTMFGNLTWAKTFDRNKNPTEETIAEFDVVFGSRNLGKHQLKIVHAKHRESGQHNHVTVLHWGPLGEVLRNGPQDFTDHEIEIQRLADGSFTLTIQ